MGTNGFRLVSSGEIVVLDNYGAVLTGKLLQNRISHLQLHVANILIYCMYVH